MMRLDKFLCDAGIGSRSQVKTYVKQGLVAVGGVVEKQADRKFDENKETVTFKGEVCQYAKYGYFMLNKPKGVVSATNDNVSETVISLLGNTGIKDLFPVGRLDKDTEGLLLITNDGALAHNLLAPKKHVDKTYLVTIAKPLGEDEKNALETGVDIGEEKPTLPAKVEVISESQIKLTIQEGKFHQVKRMLQAVDNQVTQLKRLSMGTLVLDESLKPGEFRELTEKELQLLQGKV